LADRLGEFGRVVGVVEALQRREDQPVLLFELRVRAAQTGTGLAIRGIVRDHDLALDPRAFDFRTQSREPDALRIVFGRDVERLQCVVELRSLVELIGEFELHLGEAGTGVFVLGCELQRQAIGQRRVGVVAIGEGRIALMVARGHDRLAQVGGAAGDAGRERQRQRGVADRSVQVLVHEGPHVSGRG